MSHTVKNDGIKFKFLAMSCSYKTWTTSNPILIPMPNSSLKDRSTLTPTKAMGWSYSTRTTFYPFLMSKPNSSLKDSSTLIPSKAMGCSFQPHTHA